MRVALRVCSSAATIAMVVAVFFVVTGSPSASIGLPAVESETSSASNEETQTSGPRSFLLITLDTTRADVLGCYGATPSPSPNLDRLAARSHVFERCAAPIPQTLPSHVSIFSGLYPSTHGIRKNFGMPSIDSIPLTTDVFQKKGFATGAFVSAFVLDKRFGLGRGFDDYQPARFSHAHGVEAERPGNETVDDAIAWISRQRGPWFAWVHLFDPHTPFEPPEPFASRFPGKPYLGEVAFTDHQVGRLLQALESNQVPSPTSIVICGDHGEGLGDHGEPTHGILVYESTIHVPLIVHLAGQTQGVRHTDPVSLVDLAPTLHEAAGIEGPPSDGVSLWPRLTGQAQEIQSRSIFIESLEGYFRSGWSPLFAAIRSKWKYIHSPKPELYDIVNDPHETKNLVNSQPGVVAELNAGLEPLLAGATSSEPIITDLSPAELEALTILGYVSETPGTRVQNRANPADLIHLATIHQQGIAALRAGRHTKAAALFRKELEGDPKSPLVHWYLGRSLAQDHPAEASMLFRKAIELQPSFEEPYVELCELSLRAQKMPALAPVADQGITNTQDQWGTLHYFRALGVIATGGKPEKPLADLSIAVDRARSPLRPLRLRAVIYLQHQHNVAAALSDLEALAPLLSPAELDLLHKDRTFKPLRGHKRFEALFRLQSRHRRRSSRDRISRQRQRTATASAIRDLVRNGRAVPHRYYHREGLIMRITTLIENENRENAPNLTAEFGLSMHVEIGDTAILFDTGTSGAFADNAKALGIDIAAVDAAVLSHQHFDHGGGLERFFELNDHAPVYLRKAPHSDRFFSLLGVMKRPIGLAPTLLEKHGGRFIEVDGQREIAPAVFLLTDIGDAHSRPKGNRYLRVATEQGLSPDPFDHEQMMVVRNERGMVLFTGCSHSGVLNMIDTARTAFPDTPVAAIFGGFHLIGLPFFDSMAESRAEVEALAGQLRNVCRGPIVTGHCTGKKATRLLETALGDQLRTFPTGSTFTL